MDPTICTPMSRDEAVEAIRHLLSVLPTEPAWSPDGALLTGHRLNVVAGGRRFYGFYAVTDRLTAAGFAAAEADRSSRRGRFTAVLLPLEFTVTDDGQIHLVVPHDRFGGKTVLPLEEMHIDLRDPDA